MKPVNYDDVAPSYDRRYERNRYDGTQACLQRFLGNAPRAVAEVGCGTGHWLGDISRLGRRQLFGLDLSQGMLGYARVNAPDALLVRGHASHLPWADSSLDRVFCVNALHHFSEQAAFVVECHRVLRPGGGVLTIGLDPHRGNDQWWVYDFFPSAASADRARYPASSTIREWLGVAGFRDIVTEVAQHIPGEVPFDVAREQGFLDRTATSQLMVLSDEEYAAGMSRLLAAKPILRADLTVYATVAWR